MKKNLLFLLLIFCSLSLAAQDKLYKISGVVSDQPEAKYALIFSLYKKAVFIKPIIDGRFEFNLPRERDVEMCGFMLRADTLIFFEDFASSRRSSPNDTKMIVIDNVELKTAQPISQTILSGSTLNQDLDDMFATIKSKKYEQYFATHADSPISVVFLKSLAQIQASGYLPEVDSKKYYGLFSERLKQTTEGQALAEKINL